MDTSLHTVNDEDYFSFATPHNISHKKQISSEALLTPLTPLSGIHVKQQSQQESQPVQPLKLTPASFLNSHVDMTRNPMLLDDQRQPDSQQGMTAIHQDLAKRAQCELKELKQLRNIKILKLDLQE
jgi:hypothetical protein